MRWGATRFISLIQIVCSLCRDRYIPPLPAGDTGDHRWESGLQSSGNKQVCGGGITSFGQAQIFVLCPILGLTVRLPISSTQGHHPSEHANRWAVGTEQPVHPDWTWKQLLRETGWTCEKLERLTEPGPEHSRRLSQTPVTFSEWFHCLCNCKAAGARAYIKMNLFFRQSAPYHLCSYSSIQGSWSRSHIGPGQGIQVSSPCPQSTPGYMFMDCGRKPRATPHMFPYMHTGFFTHHFRVNYYFDHHSSHLPLLNLEAKACSASRAWQVPPSSRLTTCLVPLGVNSYLVSVPAVMVCNRTTSAAINQPAQYTVVNQKTDVSAVT